MIQKQQINIKINNNRYNFIIMNLYKDLDFINKNNIHYVYNFLYFLVLKDYVLLLKNNSGYILNTKNLSKNIEILIFKQKDVIM